MLKPAPNVWGALVRLRASSDWQDVRQWLQDSLAEQDRLNRSLSGEELGRGQGRALALAEIIEKADKAADVLKKQRGYA